MLVSLPTRLPATTRTGRKAVSKRTDQEEPCQPTVLFANEPTVATSTPEGKRAPAEASSPKPTPTGLGLSTLPPVTPGLPIVVVNRSPQPTPAHGLPKLQDVLDIEAVTEALESAQLEDESPGLESTPTALPQTYSSAFFSPAATMSPNEFSTPRALPDSPCESISLGGLVVDAEQVASPEIKSAAPEEQLVAQDADAVEAVPVTPPVAAAIDLDAMGPPPSELPLELTLAPTPFPHGSTPSEVVSPEPMPSHARARSISMAGTLEAEQVARALVEETQSTPAAAAETAMQQAQPTAEQPAPSPAPGVSPAILFIRPEQDQTVVQEAEQPALETAQSVEKFDEAERETGDAEALASAVDNNKEADKVMDSETDSLIRAVRPEPVQAKSRVVASKVINPTPGFHFKSLRQLKKEIGRKLESLRKKEKPAESEEAADDLTGAMADLSLGAAEKLKGLPTPAGKHIRFDERGRAVECPAPAQAEMVDALRGLPQPTGTHLRFED